MAPVLRRARTLAVTVALVAVAAACTGDEAETTISAGGAATSSSPTTLAASDTEPPPTNEGDDVTTSEPEEATTTSVAASTGDAAQAQACDALVGSLLRPVREEDAVADGDIEAALDALVADGGEPLATYAADLLAYDALEREDVGETPLDEAREIGVAGAAAIEALWYWTRDTCTLDVPVYACMEGDETEHFRDVGGPIGDDGEVVATSTPGAPQPEDTYGEAEAGTPPDAEVVRTDDEVVVVWYDDHGAVVESLSVVRDGEGWFADVGEVCWYEGVQAPEPADVDEDWDDDDGDEGVGCTIEEWEAAEAAGEATCG